MSSQNVETLTEPNRLEKTDIIDSTPQPEAVHDVSENPEAVTGEEVPENPEQQASENPEEQVPENPEEQAPENPEQKEISEKRDSETDKQSWTISTLLPESDAPDESNLESTVSLEHIFDPDEPQEEKTEVVEDEEQLKPETLLSLLQIEPKEEAPEETKTKKKKKKKQEPKVDMTKIYGSSGEDTYSSVLLDDEDVPPTIAGDFDPIKPGSRKPSLRSYGTTPSTMTEEEVEEESEEVEEEEECDRTMLFAKYDVINKQLQEEKLKNNYLIKQMFHYYKRKMMFHVLVESKQPDAQKIYEKQLDDYYRFAEKNAQEEITIQDEIRELREKCALYTSKAQECFEQLQHEEDEVGKEIIHSEAGKHYEYKITERYLKRQKIQLNNLIKIRMNYIKIRNKVAETENALDALDNLGPNLHLIDYEELKTNNTNLRDKLEEKDLELEKVRAKCQNAVQILAHVREKIHAVELNIGYLEERFEGVSGEYEDVREQLSRLKQERDLYRKDIDKLKKNSGLLSKPRLLRNMGVTIAEEEDLVRQVDTIKSESAEINRKVKKIRKNMASPRRLETIKAIMERREMRLDSSSVLDDRDFMLPDMKKNRSEDDNRTYPRQRFTFIKI